MEDKKYQIFVIFLRWRKQDWTSLVIMIVKKSFFLSGQFDVCIVCYSRVCFSFKREDSHHAAADVHQATFTKSAIVGCRYRRKEKSPWVTFESISLHLSNSLFIISAHYHKGFYFNLLRLSSVEFYDLTTNTLGAAPVSLLGTRSHTDWKSYDCLRL